MILAKLALASAIIEWYIAN